MLQDVDDATHSFVFDDMDVSGVCFIQWWRNIAFLDSDVVWLFRHCDCARYFAHHVCVYVYRG